MKTYLNYKEVLQKNILYNLSLNYHKKQIDVFRIAIASFAIISLVTLLLDYHLFFAPDGFINWEVTNASSFWFELHPAKISEFLGADPDYVIASIIIIYLIGLLLLLMGIWTRGAAIISLMCFTGLSNVLSPYGYGVDVYQTVCLFFLCLFPTGYYLSIMPKKDYAELPTIQQISVRVLQIYLCLTYISAGIEKALMSNWWNGKFIFYLVNDPTVMSRPIIPTNWHFMVYAALGIIVVVIESFYFLLAWIPLLRSVLLIMIVGMHIFIAFSMGLFFFGWLLTTLNIVAWYPALIYDFKKLRKNDTKICSYDAHHTPDNLIIHHQS